MFNYYFVVYINFGFGTELFVHYFMLNIVTLCVPKMKYYVISFPVLQMFILLKHILYSFGHLGDELNLIIISIHFMIKL